jgi:hypothetical protein
MGISKADDKKQSAIDASGETELRGETLDGAEQSQSVAHTAQAKKRNPDAVIRVDGEADTLYNDGLELEDDSSILANTRATPNTR